MSAPPHISVLIPCHGGLDDTRACVESLLAQRGAPPFEIVVVDNASGDGTAKLDQEFDRVRVVSAPENLGFAGGVNLGIRSTRAAKVLVLNNDTLAAPELLARLDAALCSSDDIGMVAPTSNHVKGPARIETDGLGERVTDRCEIETLLAQHCERTPIQDVETLSGLCLLIRRSTLRRIGSFDSRFGLGMFEDDDLSLRMRLAGLRLVIARTAFLFHKGHRTFERLGCDFQKTLDLRLEQFRAKWQSDPAGAMYLARSTGRAILAAEHAHAALERHREYPDPHYVLATAAHAKREFADVRRHLDSFLATTPCHGPARALHAISMIATGDTEAGTARLEHALSTCYFAADELAHALADLGRVHLEMDRPNEALPHLRTAHELDPEHRENAGLLGAALMALDRLDEAWTMLELAAEDENAVAFNNLGVCAWRRGDAERAVSEFERAVEHAPRDESFRANLSQARQATRC